VRCGCEKVVVLVAASAFSNQGGGRGARLRYRWYLFFYFFYFFYFFFIFFIFKCTCKSKNPSQTVAWHAPVLPYNAPLGVPALGALTQWRRVPDGGIDGRYPSGLMDGSERDLFNHLIIPL
jgi:hypothetical protein